MGSVNERSVRECCGVFASELDWMAVAWTVRGVRRLTFGHATARAALARLQAAGDRERSPVPVPQKLQQPLVAYAAGKRSELGDLPLDLENLTAFQRRVLLACRRIPYGQTLTYAQLARRAGAAAGAARAVGQVMARNPVPLLVPCHRVVGSAGALGGFSAPRGVQMKRQLLQLERAAP